MSQTNESSTAHTDNAEFYKTLLESTKAIPWQIDWKAGRFTYIGPQIQSLLGWSADSWVSVEDWATRMHPDDRDCSVNYCISQSKEGLDHEMDYRALTADGDYVWIRDVVHVIRENDEVVSLVGFMFDISERKKNEEELLRLKKELEILSYQDSLTGIANRRMFDQVLQRQWASAIREQQALSLIILDIDEFKKYNDHYGHSKGDEALQQVAQKIQKVLRASDLAARFGGEEFVVLLPETTAQSACIVAERIRASVEAVQIPHAQASAAPYVTISLGVGSITPSSEDEMHEFIRTVDAELYRAKNEGRNRYAVKA